MLSKILALLALCIVAFSSELLNVSYDATREFYKEYNALFSQNFKEKTGKDIKIYQSHGGSGAQARMINEGLKAHIASLALSFDIDKIAQNGLLEKEWQDKFQNSSTPFYSTIVFLVRKGNPKGIKEWEDLIKEGVKIITPNPKTSGGARWNHMAALAYANAKYANFADKKEQKVDEFLTALYQNVPVFDTGARGAANTFIKRNIGDVLIAWENEALLAAKKIGRDKFEVITPSISIYARPVVAVVSKNTKTNEQKEIANAYINGLYEPSVQCLAARNFFRPFSQNLECELNFAEVKMVDISEFGGWNRAQEEHFASGAKFDEILANLRKASISSKRRNEMIDELRELNER